MEKFVKLGTERIRLSEIKSYSATNVDLCVETEDDYFTYKKEDIDNYDAVIKYLDDELTINNSKINVSTLEPISPVKWKSKDILQEKAVEFTWDDVLKGNIFNTKTTKLIPITIYDIASVFVNRLYKKIALNHIIKLMKENIPGFDSRSALFIFGSLLEFDDDGFIKKFNTRIDYFSTKFNMFGSFNYWMIMVVKQLYKYMISTGYLKEIPEFDWDVEGRLWNRNGNLRLEEDEMSLIMKLLSGELLKDLNLFNIKELKINMTSKKIIDSYLDLRDILLNNFMKEIPQNITDENDPLRKFMELRALFCNTINNECGIHRCDYK